MKKLILRVLSVVIVLCLLLGMVGCASKSDDQMEEGKNRKKLAVEEGDDDTDSDTDTDTDTDSDTDTDTDDDGKVPDNTAKQLTEADIQDMNNGNALFEYSEDGYCTTIIGKFYKEKVGQDFEMAIESIKGVATLIGLSEGSAFFCESGAADDEGNTYFTYRQKYGDNTIQYATLKVMIDSNGYVFGLTSSLIPNIGFAEKTDEITAKEAEEIVRAQMTDKNNTIYEESTAKVAVSFDGMIVRDCYAVYTENPEVSISFDLMYLQHYVGYDGTYYGYIPVSSRETKNTEGMKAEQYLENMTAATYKGTVTLHDGSIENIEVPVAFNDEDDRYYLVDINRKILSGDYYSFNYKGDLGLHSSETNSGWDNDALIAYQSYIKAYDFYENIGLPSIDGFGTPILIMNNYVDDKGNPIDNACFCGIINGFACFAASKANDYSECLDIILHEFTHGVTSTAMCGSFYQNETGAINEAYSDIMGNLGEMLTGETTDTKWYVGEVSGKTTRCMSNPNAYAQPAFVGDEYYLPSIANPIQSVNDLGGVHQNNSLLSQVCYQLYLSGMSLEQESEMWLTTIQMLTPKSDYDDIYLLLQLSLKVNGLEEYIDELIEIYTNVGLLVEDRDAVARTVTKSGCGRIEFATGSEIASSGVYLVTIFDSNGNYLTSTWPAEDGYVSILLDVGVYYVAVVYVGDTSNTFYYHTGNGWNTDPSIAAMSIVSEGMTTTLTRAE